MSDQPDGLAPPWLLRDTGKAFLGALGDGLDYVAGATKEAVKSRFPAICAPDALAQIGSERSIDQGPTETEASYRARLLAAWDLWQLGGTPLGLLRALYVAGYKSTFIQTQNAKQYTLDASQSLVTSTILASPPHLGGQPAELWNDIAIFIVRPFPTWWTVSGIPADGSAEVQFIRHLISTWKPAHSRVVGLKAISGPAWNVASLTWGAFSWSWGTATTWTPPT